MALTRLLFGMLALALLAGSILWFAIVSFLDQGGDGGAAWVDTASERTIVAVGYFGVASALGASIASFALVAKPNSRFARVSLIVGLTVAAEALLLYSLGDGFG